MPCDPTNLVRFRQALGEAGVEELLGRVLRDIERKMSELPLEQQASLQVWLERAWRICRQRPKDKNKLYALHAPEAECIGKGKACQPYEVGVKVSLAITERHGLIVGARAFPGNPYDGHVFAEQLEQTSILLQEVQGEARVKTVLTDLGYRGVHADVALVQLGPPRQEQDAFEPAATLA